MNTVNLNNYQTSGRTRLNHWGVIKAEGEDAAKFLHGQLTNDFALLGNDTARLAVLCSPKGRMLASFIGFKRLDATILLICTRDILESTLKRLSMFVLRAKVRLSDASEEYPLWGLTGEAAIKALPSSPAIWSKLDVGEATAVQLYPARGVPRALWVSNALTDAPAVADIAATLWNWLEIHSGVATIGASAVDKFVPQMLNYESVGGINFKKGCYPGQEVVARSQFRGTLKRRGFLIHGDTEMTGGSEIFTNLAETESVATVVQVAASPTGGFDAIASGNIQSLDNASLHAGAHDGPILTILPLPYPLLEDI